MESEEDYLTALTEAERTRALERFQCLRPFLEEEIPLAQLARRQGVSVRTAWSWVKRYRRYGLTGLARKPRNDKDRRKVSSVLCDAIEGLALQRPPLPIATIHRKAKSIAATLGEPPPSYSFVYKLKRNLEPGLLALAHEGASKYSNDFDLVHRAEAEGPNAIWQADHSMLDIRLIDEHGQAGKPWLTIILDDYSRAVAGYLLSFSAPSALQTALALRQAIWRKAQPGWHVCGIPQILYTDHGSDFTSRRMEQVAADLKIQLVFSAVGKPRGRGKIERFFSTISQTFLSQLPGYVPSAQQVPPVLTLPQLTRELESWIINSYHVLSHQTTGQAPQARWETGGFLPHMPDSLEQLDLLLLTVPKSRVVHRDGIRFMSYRYIDPTLAAYVGEEVMLRYDPRDIAEIRVFYKDHFLCRAVCQELAGQTVSLREIVGARDRRRRQLQQTLRDRKHTVDKLMETRRWEMPQENAPARSPENETKSQTLKRYYSE